jgi:uncharacterized protein YgiM (DUF1202 family)
MLFLLALVPAILMLPAAAGAQGLPALALDRYSGPANTQVWLTASGFPPGSPINISMVGANSEWTWLGGGVTDANGRFTVKALAAAAPGTVIVFSAVGQAEHQPEARFTVTGGNGAGTVPTDVERIVSVSGVNVRSGPGYNYPVIGWLRAGETAEVTGLSPDRGWWQIRCGQGDGGFCWVRAQSNLTKPAPVDSSGSWVVYDTDVQYVRAITPVNIRSGPGMGFQVVGQMPRGQVARVTGVSARGDWWRIECAAAAWSECWVTAKAMHTQPTNPGF